jgi:hypothetical protein
MKYIAKFDHPANYSMILRDSFQENTYYGLDAFDCKYLKIVQSKFGCINSFHTIPDHVKMEMAPFEWTEKKQKFVLNDKKRHPIRLNRLEIMIVSYSLA